MAKKSVQSIDKTIRFTARTPLAITMTEVAKSEEFNGKLIVGSWPIIGKADALEAFGKAIQIDESVEEGAEGEPEQSEMTDEDVERVKERYLELGRVGNNSVINVSLTEGNGDFDFAEFYSRVGEAMPEGQALPIR